MKERIAGLRGFGGVRIEDVVAVTVRCPQIAAGSRRATPVVCPRSLLPSRLSPSVEASVAPRAGPSRNSQTTIAL
eukprot:COSAG01_NODE_6787_length_3498_cov_6.123272_4_plen_75_part_00